MNDDLTLRPEQDESVTVHIDQPSKVDPHETARQEAFDAAHSWKGIPLQPFSSGRRREWGRMRAHDGGDPSFMDDAIKIVWLALQPRDELLIKRRDLTAMCAECWTWADETISTEDHDALLDLAEKLVTESQINQATPIPSNSQQPGN